jgi:hypothetical protein
MTKDAQSRAIVRAYYDAWVDGDIDTAGMVLTDAFTNFTPINNYYTPSDYLESLRKFHQIMTSIDLVSELYGENEATLLYHVHLATPVGSSLIVEHFRLTNGKISSITSIFDATPWRKGVQPA